MKVSNPPSRRVERFRQRRGSDRAIDGLRFSRVVGLTLLCVFAVVVHQTVAGDCNDAPKSDRTIEPVRTSHLPSVLRVAGQVLVGGTPNGEAGFRELSQQGVQTIISVDHAIPDTRTANRFGIRYVHLPVDYSGLDDQRVYAIAALLKSERGRVYLHCHHGKHRAPAATAASCIAAGLLSSDDARSLLKIAGTSKHYRGLFASVEATTAQPDAVLDIRRFHYSERADVPATAARMVEIDRLFERLSEREDLSV
ncbi:MAG: hypothetical protein AAGJ83_06380, partial [Planctomycetota bacterium]